MRIAFDLDGTLIDSAPDIHAAVNAMLADNATPPLSLARVTGFVGNGLPHLVGLVIDDTGLDMASHSVLTQQVLHHYTHPTQHLTIPFDGVIDALETLHAAGHRMGICTNKPIAATHAELDRLNLSRFFSVTIGGDSLRLRKPDPTPLTKTLSQLGTGPALFVGDSEVDAQTAHRAAIPFALFTKGYRQTPVRDLPHNLAFDHPQQLLAWIAQNGP